MLRVGDGGPSPEGRGDLAVHVRLSGLLALEGVDGPVGEVVESE